MPRFFDPTKSDPTIIAINWVDQILTEKLTTLSHEDIEKYIKRFQQEKLFANYKNKEIVISNNCSRGNIFLDYDNIQNKYFPVFNNGNQIVICQNMILNSVQLLENLIREFELSQNQIQTQGCKFISACSKAYQIYKFPFEKHKQLSDICAKILMRHRGENKELLPLDQWIRYIEREIKSQQCYNV
ncbi:unnamed protein product [Paramecium pentaurelia]|uniref:Uncharacterized protein n=1 Tax=Paramecium pentaurelia TaxID=43138 RepID=A0A8S1SL66_9CILI|nr:unnamed protein product [Paramecium pentaurelia]